jgi:hypothetical protein
MNGTPMGGVWNTTAVKINLTSVRGDAFNNVTGIWYKLDIWNNGTWVAQKAWTNYSVSGKNVSIATNGTIRISYNATVYNFTSKGYFNETTKLKTLYIDMNAPTMDAPVLVGTAGNLGWYKSAVNVTLKASNDSAKWWLNSSGLKSTTYKIGTAAANVTTYVNMTDMAAGVKFVVSAQGTTSVNYSSMDNASLMVEGATNLSIKIDSVAPTTDAADAAITTENYTFTAADATSGVASVAVDGTAVTAVNGTYKVVLTDGSHTLNITVTDVAGNVLTKSVTVNVTLTPAVVESDNTMLYIIIIVIIVVVVVVVAVMMMRGKKGKAAEAPAADEKS